MSDQSTKLRNLVFRWRQWLRGRGQELAQTQHQQLTTLILQRITNLETNIMSKLSEWAAEQEADLTAIRSSLDAIGAGIIALDKQIAELQNSPGAITAEDQAILDRIQRTSKELVNRARDIKVDAETNPPPNPGPVNPNPTQPV